MGSRTTAYLDEITAPADVWVRHCNRRPEGYRMTRDRLRVVLAASDDVHLDAEGRIAWRAGGHQFTAKPAAPESEVISTAAP